MNAMLLQGIFPAMTTPFYPDGRLNPLKLEHNVVRMSLTPAAGMVMLGSTGEAVLLRESEQAQVLERAIAAAAPGKVMIAGVGHESATATLEMAAHAARLRYDAVMVRTPSFYRAQMGDAEMLHYYRLVADRCALPVVLYSIPSCTGYSLPLGVIVELSRHPNIIGIKDSAGDVERIAAIVAATAGIAREVAVTPTFFALTQRMRDAAAVPEAGSRMVAAELLMQGGGTSTLAPPAPAIKSRVRKVGFQVLAGSAAALLASLDAGASGAVLALAAAAPQACYEVYTAQREGDVALAAEKQQRLLPAAEAGAGRFGVPGVKYAAELNGYFGGQPRAPLLPLDAEAKRQVSVAMQELRA